MTRTAPAVASDADVDPALSEMVDGVANRFGLDGLDDLIRLANEKRPALESALEELAELRPLRP